MLSEPTERFVLPEIDTCAAGEFGDAATVTWDVPTGASYVPVPSSAPVNDSPFTKTPLSVVSLEGAATTT